MTAPDHASPHHQAAYRGMPSRSIATSRLVETGNISQDSLPGLSKSTTSVASHSSSSSMGEREMMRRMRLLVSGFDGVLLANNVPRLPNDPDENNRLVLECPLKILGCPLDFASPDDWFKHSLDHFFIKRPHTHGPAIVMPPTSNRCCFCPKEFFSPSGWESWIQRMAHVAHHHQIGHSLSHARPDFPFYDYLWENHLIDEVDYREIKGNTENAARRIFGNPSPPLSETSDTPPSSPDAQSSQPVTFVNDRREDRRRNGQRRRT